jgi:hypothetical protein
MSGKISIARAYKGITFYEGTGNWYDFESGQDQSCHGGQHKQQIPPKNETFSWQTSEHMVS